MARLFSKNFILTLSLTAFLAAGTVSCGSKRTQSADPESTEVTASDAKSSKKTKKAKKPKKLTFNRLLKSNDYMLKYNKALEYYAAKKNDKALTLFEDIKPYLLNTPQEDSLLFYTGVANYRKGDFEISSEIFDNFRKRFGRSPFIEEAEYLFAMGFYHSSPRPELDQVPSMQALNAFRDYLERYPQTKRREEVEKYNAELQQKLYDKSLLNAKVYYNIGYHNNAVFALKNALQEYPASNHREELLYLIVRSSHELAKNSVDEMQHSRYLDLVDAYYNLISEFPESSYKKEVTRYYDEAQKYIKSQNNPDTENGNQEERTE